MLNPSSPQVITCKAAVCWGAGEEMKVEEIQVEPPKSSEVRIKMLCASVCHTDITMALGFPFPIYPRVLGHEGVGVVESIGNEVKDVKEGDLVVPTFLGECQECENCKSGETNICIKYPLTFDGLMSDGTSRMSVRGQKIYHLMSCSTWSEYTVIDSNYVLKIDPTVNLAHASFLSCGYSTGFGSAWKLADVQKGSTVAVIGLGAVGLGAIEAARIQGASRIIGVDRNAKKKEKGEAFGMTDFINPDESEKSISEQIKELTGGAGVNSCLECAGVGPLINQSLLATKPGIGKTIMVGAPNDATLQLSTLPLLYGATLKGGILGGLKVKSHLPILFDKSTNNTKKLHLEELLTHEVDLKDINKAFRLVNEPTCVKLLIKISV